MAIKTRETTATGVTNKGAPLTNAELDNNFVELVANKAELDDLSVTTNASGTAALSYDNTTGVFSYTPPDLSAVSVNDEDIDDRVNALLQAGNGIALDYDDANNELTISSEDTEITAYNGTGATLSKGTVVYQSGVQGQNISVAAASNGSASTMPAVGIVLADIADQATGQIALAGLVRTLDTSSFTAGDVLYVGTSGALTATKPTGESSLIQNFGRALFINASSGEILVLGAGRTNDTPNLNDGNVFIGNASNQAEARALVEADISDLGTYLTAESDTLDSVTDRGATTTNAISVGNITATNITIDGAIEEQQYSLTGTVIDPANGTIQYKTLGNNTTFTESLANGEFVTLMIDDGNANTVTWPTITWVGGSAPTLGTTGYNVIHLWQINNVLYGAFIGTTA